MPQLLGQDIGGITMETSPEHEPAMPQRSLPAWMCSLLFHCGAVALLAVSLDAAPRGAADEPGRSAGIVLKLASDDGDLYEGEASLAEPADTAAQELSAAELLAALPSDSAAAEVTKDLPRLLSAGPAIAGGQPHAGQFTTGGASRGATPGGKQARVRVFGVEGVGTKFVYVFDHSTSMQGPPLAAAKQQLLDSLQSLESIHQFQIIFFNHQLRSFDLTGGGNRIAFATDRNKQLAAKFVGGIIADGGTDRLPALRAALALRPDVIFFLTDADDPMPPSELADIARLHRRAGTAICTIEFGRGDSRRSMNFLVQLAEQTGGQHDYVDTARLAP